MGLKKNFIYNSTLTLSQYIIGLITFPYVSRVLGVSNVGIVGFVDNSSNYFVLFCTMGIGIMGVRETAKFRNDQAKLDSVFSSLLTLSLIFTISILSIYLICIFFIPQFNNYKALFLIGSAKIIFTTFLIEWFFRGIENFKYISIRNIFVKIVYVISLFLFVREKDDYNIYFILTTGLVVINAIINITYARKFVNFSLKNINLTPYFIPSISIGIYIILTSTYTTFNVMYLGFVSTTTEVGYYWAALKIYAIFLGFYTAFTNVMMPRMSSLLSENKHEEFSQMIKKSFNILFSISLPVIIISTVLSPELISVLSGNEYGDSARLMRIIMPLILVVGVAQIMAIQVLLPLGRDKIILKASIIGAVTGVLLNFLLVRKYGSTGTASVLFLSEISVTTYYLYQASKLKIIEIPWASFYKNLIGAIPYIFIPFFVKLIFDNHIMILVVSGTIAFIYLLFIQFYYIKNDFIYKLIDSAKVYVTKHTLKNESV